MYRANKNAGPTRTMSVTPNVTDPDMRTSRASPPAHPMQHPTQRPAPHAKHHAEHPDMRHSHAAQRGGSDPRLSERQRPLPDHSDLLAELGESPSDEEDIIFKKGSTDEEQQQASKKDMTILIIIFALVVIALIAIIIWIMMRDTDRAAEADVQQMMQRPPPMPPQRMQYAGPPQSMQQYAGQPQGGPPQGVQQQNVQQHAGPQQRPLTTTQQHNKPAEVVKQDKQLDKHSNDHKNEQPNDHEDEQPDDHEDDEPQDDKKTQPQKEVPVVKLVGLFSNSTTSADDVLKQTRAILDPRYDEKDRELLNRKSRDEHVTLVLSMEDQEAEDVSNRVEVIE